MIERSSKAFLRGWLGLYKVADLHLQLKEFPFSLHSATEILPAITIAPKWLIKASPTSGYTCLILFGPHHTSIEAIMRILLLKKILYVPRIENHLVGHLSIKTYSILVDLQLLNWYETFDVRGRLVLDFFKVLNRWNL